MKLTFSCEGEPKEIVALLNALLNDDDTDKKEQYSENVRNQVIATFERAAKIQAARQKSEQQQ